MMTQGLQGAVLPLLGMHGIPQLFVRENMIVETSAGPYCKYTIPKIRNKSSQKRNCAASVPNFHLHVSVSDLYINFNDHGLPFLLQQKMWTDPGNK
jgi:hypothetical protein